MSKTGNADTNKSKKSDGAEEQSTKKAKKMKRPSLVSYILGYYIAEIPRTQAETFLNLCMRYGFTYYDLQADSESGRVRILLPLSSKKNLFSACKVWQIRIRTVSRHGLWATLSKFRGRWGIAVGLLLSFCLFGLSQSVLWRIDIVGNERLDCEQVISALSQNGMSVGDIISRINTDSVEQRVMINDDDIAWISVNISGTVATVEVREVSDTEIKDKEMKPSNLVAKYDAEIVALEVLSGFIAVKSGEFVKAGQLLVSGIYESEKAPLRYTRSSGRVLGKINRTFEVEIPLKQSVKVPTGAKIEQKTLIFFGKSIKLFLNSGNLEQSCDIINYEYIFNPFSLGALPVSFSVDTFYPYTYETVEISDGEAMELAYAELQRLIENELPDAQLLRKSLDGGVYDGKYILKCNLTAVCDIAELIEFEIIK